MPVIGTVPALLEARLRSDAAGPLVTCYDDATGERTELSAATFANWVAKTANLLVDGLGLGRGDGATLALPLHWQSLVVAAGCWQAGLRVRFAGPAEVTFVAEGGEAALEGGAVEGGAHPAMGEVVALSLRPLGAGLTRPSSGVTDYAAEVRAYGDRFTGRGPAPHDEALPGTTHTQLWGRPGEARRVLLAPAGDPLLDAALVAAAYLDPLLGGGSVVLCRHADPALLDRRAASERSVRATVD